jgi:pentatricopeptide repeat protein
VISPSHRELSSSSVGFRIEYRTFNAFIAAFGKHGQLKMAFQLADELVEVGFIPNEDTYASLLIACSSEKVVGFKYAIEVRPTERRPMVS